MFTILATSSDKAVAAYPPSPCATPPNAGAVQGILVVPPFTHTNDTSYDVGDTETVASDLCVEYSGTGATLNSLQILQNPAGCPNPAAGNFVAGDNRVWIDWGANCVDVGDWVQIQFKSAQGPVVPENVVWTKNGTPVPFKTMAEVDGVTIIFRADSNVGRARADVARAQNQFLYAFDGSSGMKTNVTTAGNTTVYVHRDNTAIKNGLTYNLGRAVFIDMGDIDEVIEYMETGTQAAKEQLASVFDIDVIVHEFGHRAGKADPTAPNNKKDDDAKGPTVISENTILQQLGTGVRRDNYSYFEGTPQKCKIDYTVNSVAVKINATDLKGAGEWACQYASAVGGTAELPPIEGVGLESTEPSATDHNGLAWVIGGATAGVFILAAAGTLWFTRRR